MDANAFLAEKLGLNPVTREEVLNYQTSFVQSKRADFYRESSIFLIGAVVLTGLGFVAQEEAYHALGYILWLVVGTTWVTSELSSRRSFSRAVEEISADTLPKRLMALQQAHKPIHERLIHILRHQSKKVHRYQVEALYNYQQEIQVQQIRNAI